MINLVKCSRWGALAAVSVLMLGCETLSTPEDTITAPADCPPLSDGVATLGEVEWVTINPQGIRQKARIDTGAQTTSIGALNPQRFERDGERWVAFTIKDRDSGQETVIKRPIKRVAKIKRHNAESVERFVVELTLSMGSISEVTEVSLADREKFEFPVLIGRNFLEGEAVVDVSRKFVTLDQQTKKEQ
jgi:hypothetical protein